MDIVHITSEYTPIAKVGGLGDAVSGLAKAQAKLGKHVAVILPKYKNLSALDCKDCLPSGIDLFLIDVPDIGSKIYGEPNDIDRFGFFCKEAAALIRKLGPKVVHLHDWPAAIASFFELQATVVFTIHNLKHQGRCAPHNLERVGLDPNKWDLKDPVYPEALNLVKGAIARADLVTTVSPSYLEEICLPEGGFGLDNFLRSHREKLHGILNGIDTEYWDPARDPHLAAPFGSDLFKAKEENKHALFKRFGIPSGFLLAVITRLVPQKDPDAIEMGIRLVTQEGGQTILLGSSLIPEIQSRFEALASELKPTGQAGFFFGFDEPLAHLVYAGADAIFIPSLFEPCGLTQKIGMRYGTVSIVRATGGLKDTVFDEVNGFTFKRPEEMEKTLKSALHIFNTDRPTWNALALKGYQGNYSWEPAAKKLLILFAKNNSTK